MNTQHVSNTQAPLKKGLACAALTSSKQTAPLFSGMERWLRWVEAAVSEQQIERDVLPAQWQKRGPYIHLGPRETLEDYV